MLINLFFQFISILNFFSNIYIFFVLPDKILLAWYIPISFVQIRNIRKVFSSTDPQHECEEIFRYSAEKMK
jgi:hypothetical protein